MALTPSEDLVARLAHKTFLSLWGEPNPLYRPGKELCDFLVVCDPDVVLLSVKEVVLRQREPLHLDRWGRRAIDESVNQLYGAQRRLASIDRVIKADGTPGGLLPPKGERRVHRIAIALVLCPNNT